MITLTMAPLVGTVLGGSTTVAYDKFVLTNLNFNTKTQKIDGSVEMSASSDIEMSPISGSLSITPATAALEIRVPQLDFYRRVVLSGPQNATIQAIVTDTQNTLENGLISLGTIDGVQTPGV